MSKVTITGGVISVEDGTKAKEEFAPARKVRVELHFDVPEGSDAMTHVDAVSHIANVKLKALLAGTTVAPSSATTAPAAAPQAGDGKPALSDKDILAAKAGLSQADLDAAAKAAEGKKPAAPKAPKAPGKKAADKPAPDPDDLTGEIAPEAPAETASEDDELFTVQPEEITDADLNHIVQVKNGEFDGKGGSAIKKIISSYNPDPTKAFTLKQIPQAARAEFKERIGALTAKDIK